MNREYKDSEFKEKFEIKGMKKFNEKCINSNGVQVYLPDLILYDDKNIVIIEQSSNYTPKIHISELTQFIEYVHKDRFPNSEKREYSFILILTPKESDKLKKDIEATRLRVYWEMLSNIDGTEKIQFIGVCHLNDLKEFDSIPSLELIKQKCEKVNNLV